ncbi:MAG: family 10 glycosylhydrolase [Candidatus Zhuqueibacterota bacterium]
MNRNRRTWLRGWLLFLFSALFFSHAAGANKEARAVWLSRFEYTPLGYSASRQRQFIEQAVKNLHDARFNMLIFQVRGQADAFYRSDYEPWSDRLTGTLGKNPGWDPLQYAIDMAHENAIELHAWINVFPCWQGAAPPQESTPRHLFLDHPEWICCDPSGIPMTYSDEGYASLSPGIPEVRDYLKNICLDIVTNYEIDGLHFDYIRYPNRQYSHDPISESLFHDPVLGNPENLTRADWQRSQVNLFVRDVYEAIMAIKPHVKISAAVIGKYNYSEVSWDGYNACYQDGAQWTAEAKIDILAPMMYWPIGQLNPWAPFEVLARDWVFNNANGRFILGGIGAYKNENNFPEIAAQIDTLRAVRAQGQVFFSYSSLDDSYFWDDLIARHYKHLANVPAMTWKDDAPPNRPAALEVKWLSPTSIAVNWQPPAPAADGDIAEYYNIYRCIGRSPIDIEDPKHLYKITSDATGQFVDTGLDSAQKYYYWISALDDADNEGGVTSYKRATSVVDDAQRLPGGFALRQNYPNPFNGNTRIEYTIPFALESQRISLVIYDISGRKVRVLLDGILPAGDYATAWDGADDQGQPVPSGFYVYRLECDSYQAGNKMLLLK